jgi:pimeloyl-ACP methyl ester carboxylesterase
MPEFVELNGYRIAYHRQGHGEPMLLIHGITTYSFIWRNLIPDLAKKYDVIALDLLGCGDSDKPAEVDYSIHAQAGMIKEMLDKLGIKEVHLVCHDIGGGVGQILSVQHPGLVSSLVLINSIGYDYWPVQPIITMRVPFIRHLAMAAMDMGIFRMIIKRGVYHKDRVTKELMNLYRKPLRTDEGRRGFLHLAKCLNNNHLMDIADDISELDMPVMIIKGEADPYLDKRIANRLHSEIKGSRLEVIETGGHFIMEDEPEMLVKLILDFIPANDRQAQL